MPTASPRASGHGNALRTIGIAILLSGAVLVIYAPVMGFEFVWDDHPFLLDNEWVREGLRPSSLARAFASDFAANWYPLTWISHMLDFELFGSDPAGHHATNVFLHLVNTLLLFGLLTTSTKQLGPSAALAALFAVHPLNVETVAWVSQRKTLLSTGLGLLSMLAYVSWFRRGGVGRYGLSASLLALALMAKPMLVTLPCIFLLWDFWPLRRIEFSQREHLRGRLPPEGKTDAVTQYRIWRLLIEKIPFFLLVAASSFITLFVQTGGGAMRTIPLELRLGNAIVSYARYLAKALSPARLSPFYGHPDLPGGTPWEPQQILGAAALLIAISSCIWIVAARRHLVVGWLWYLGTLVPVIGVVQVGNQAMADRYAYLPLVGILLMVTFAVTEGLERIRARGFAAPIGAITVVTLVIGFGAQARVQLAIWSDDVTLFRRAAELQPGPSMIHYNLGRALQVRGETEAALAELRLALSVAPDGADIHNNLYVVLWEAGRKEAAFEHLEAGLRFDPANADLQNNMGLLLLSRNDPESAVSHFQTAVRSDGKRAAFRDNLGAALGAVGRFSEAEEQFRAALRLEPGFARAHFHVGLLHAAQGQLDPAIERFQRALALDPELEGVDSSLARALRLKRGMEGSP